MNQKMREARRKKNISQGELAKQVGVARQTINMVENGEYNPTLTLCVKICTALECTLDDLFWEGS